MRSNYAGYSIAPNGDVTIQVSDDEDYCGYDAVIPFAEFQGIAEESADAERGHCDLPIKRGMI